MMPKNFNEYLDAGIIKRCSPDSSRARFLISESEKSFRGLKERLVAMIINEYNANSIVKDCHDIIMELIRARLLLDGYNSSGQFAHEAEVSYLKILGFSEKDVSLANELRYFRNSVTYYGKQLTVEYAEKVTEFTERMYLLLKQKVKQ
ncbi:MAG: hypothetical protein AABW49_01275 [Nanoarchaeota archaeon]